MIALSVDRLCYRNRVFASIPVFQDVNVMIFVGFGFLMTFLKHYGYGAVGLTLLCGSYAIQTSMLARGLYRHSGDLIEIDVNRLARIIMERSIG